MNKEQLAKWMELRAAIQTFLTNVNLGVLAIDVSLGRDATDTLFPSIDEEAVAICTLGAEFDKLAGIV